MPFSGLNLSDLHPGDALPEVVKHLSQDKVNLYANAAGDFNPIHVDEAFAAKTDFGGTIAHGMLILAYVSEMMTLAFGESWFSAGKLAIRFKSPAHSKDTVTATGKINSISEEDGIANIKCNVTCRNQKQDTIVIGEASVKISLNNEGI